MNSNQKLTCGVIVSVACVLGIWINMPPKIIESERSIRTINRSNLNNIRILLDVYRSEHAGQLPGSLDDLKQYMANEGDSKIIFKWRASFDDAGEPWIYTHSHSDGILVISPKPVNGITVKLTDQGEIIETPKK